MLTCTSFFDLSEFSFAKLFMGTEYVWQGLSHLKSFMNEASYPDFNKIFPKNGEPLPKTIVLYEADVYSGDEVDIAFGDAPKGLLKVCKDGKILAGASVIMAGVSFLGNQIHIGKGVLIEPGAMISSPTSIDDQTVVRQGAYIRGYCLFGKRCVVGHVTEVKHSIFLNDAKAGHFAYLGDSILGNNANLGAGTKLANLRFTSGNVQIKTPDGSLDSGLRKFGAIVGDNVQTGCNSVTNPGTLLGPRSMVLPNTTVPSGLHKACSIIRG
jgi:acetyltransferase-like isoleucine patch superfamily enzyme